MRPAAAGALLLAATAALAAPFTWVDPNAGCDVAVNPTCDSEYEAPRIVTAIGDQSSTVGVADSLDPTSSIYCGGAVANPVWSATLPAGLSITPSTGAISGTPLAAGAVASSITCTNDLDTVTANLTWTVSGATATVPTWTASPIAGQYTMTVGQETVVDLATLGANIEDIIVTRSTEALADGGPLPDWCSLTGTTLSCTPTATGVTVLHVRATNGVHDAAASWAARTVGAVASEDFSGSTSVSAVASEVGGVAGDSVRDATVGLTGGVSMRQRTPGGAEQADVSGHDTRWLIRTSAAADDVFPGCLATECDDAYGYTPGQTMCLSYSVLLDRASVRYAGWQPNQTPKITIIDQMPGWPGQATANNWELVTTLQDGHLAGYTGKQATQYADQWQDGLATACNASDFRLHEIDFGANPLNGTDPGLATGAGAGSTWDACQQDRARYGRLYSYGNNELYADGDPVDPLSLSPGAMPEGTDWTHVQQCVVVGTPGLTEHEFRAWVAPHGQDWTLVETRIGYDPGDWTATQASVYEAAWFVTLAFGAPVDASRPEARRWIDDVIVSTAQTPAPCFSGECTLRSADAVLTIQAQAAAGATYLGSDNEWVELSTTAGTTGNDWSDVDPRTDNPSWDVRGSWSTDYHDGLIDAWGTLALAGNSLYSVAQGGHKSSTQNAVYRFGPLDTPTPQWTRVVDPIHDPDTVCSPSQTWEQLDFLTSNDPYDCIGHPLGRHGYNQQVYVPPLDSGAHGDVVALPGGYALMDAVGGNFTLETAAYDVGAGAYLAENAWPDWSSPSAHQADCFVWDPTAERVLYLDKGPSPTFGYLDPRNLAGGWVDVATLTGAFDQTVACAYDSVNELFVLHTSGGGGVLWVIDADHDSSISGSTYGAAVTLTSTDYAATGGTLAINQPIGMTRDAAGCVLALGPAAGGELYYMAWGAIRSSGALNASATATWTYVPSTGVSPAAPAQAWYQRAQFVADIGAIVAFPDADFPLYARKLPAAGVGC